MALFSRVSRGRKKRLILDIGTSAVRVCELSPTKAGYQLTKYFQKEFNSDPSLDEEARKALRLEAVAELLKTSKIRLKKTIFGVPGQSVFTRTRTLPPVPEYKVTQIVRYEIQQQIPFSLDQIAMSYQILNRTEAGGYEVMMAAIKVDVVEKHVDILNKTKRAVDVVDVSPLGAYNWLKHTGEFGEKGECVAMVDLGATTTDIVIERENQFRFTRPLNIGGNDITQAIAAAFGMSFTEAERVKRERGFAPTGDPQRDGKGGEVIGQVLQRFVAEIMRSFAYFRSLPGGGPVNRVIFCGGGACMRNIIPYFQRQLGIESRIAQPLAGLVVAPGAQQVNDRPEQACVVLGLALRCCEPVPIEINLIPPRVLEMARQKEQVFYWALSLATLALIMASIIPVSANENKLVQQRIETLKRYIGQYDPELQQRLAVSSESVPPSKYKQQLMTARSDVQKLQGYLEVLDRAHADRRFWLDEIAFVSEARPPSGGMWFSAVETSYITEAVIDPNAPPGTAPAAPPRQRRGGTRSRDRYGDDEDMASGPSGPVDYFSSSGFPGVESFGGAGRPGVSGGGGGGMGLGLGGGGGRNRRRDDEDDLGGSTTMTQAASLFSPDRTARGFPEPNGLTITGFAESDTVVREYVEALKKLERQLFNRRYIRVGYIEFKEAEVEKVPWSILYNAPTEARTLKQSVANATGGYYDPNNSLYSFALHIKFVQSLTQGGEPIAERAQAVDAPPPSAGIGAGGVFDPSQITAGGGLSVFRQNREED